MTLSSDLPRICNYDCGPQFEPFLNDVLDDPRPGRIHKAKRTMHTGRELGRDAASKAYQAHPIVWIEYTIPNDHRQPHRLQVNLNPGSNSSIQEQGIIDKIKEYYKAEPNQPFSTDKNKFQVSPTSLAKHIQSYDPDKSQDDYHINITPFRPRGTQRIGRQFILGTDEILP